MKVFFDTNVVLAAFATRGLCADLFAHVLLEHELLVGETVIRELRSKLRIKLKFTKSAIARSRPCCAIRSSENPPEHLNLRFPTQTMSGSWRRPWPLKPMSLSREMPPAEAQRAPLPIVSPRGLWEMLRGAEPER